MQQFLIRHLAPWLGAVLLALGGATPTARAQAVDWARTVGHSQSGWTIAQIVADPQDNTYICGSFSDTLSLGAFTIYAPDSLFHLPGEGAADVFVAKFDPNGNCLWAARAGGQGLGGSGSTRGYDAATALALDATGNVFVTGGFDSYVARFGPIALYNAGSGYDMFIAKLDGATGQWLWAQRAGGPNRGSLNEDFAQSVQVDATGDVYVLGHFDTNIFQAGGFSLVRGASRGVAVLKLAGATGQWLWASAGNALIPGLMTLDNSGHVFIAGRFMRSAQFGPTTLLAYLAPGNIINTQCFVARLSATTGAWQWAAQGGDSNQQNGGAVITGLAGDAQNICTISGAILGSPTAQFGSTVLLNRSWWSGTSNGQLSDALVARLDSSGHWLSAFSAGGPAGEGLSALTVEPNGLLCAVGGLDGTAFGLGSTTLQCPTPSNFLVRIDAANNAWTDAAVISNSSPTTYRSLPIRSLCVDALGRRYVAGNFRAPACAIGAVTLPNPATGPRGTAGFVARLAAGPLVVPTAALPTPAGLGVWPNPATGTVRISGPAPGQTVWLVDMQGRRVAASSMPAEGPLVLPLPTSLAVGLYVVRAPGTGLTRRLVVE